jgi:hypothetical protein
MWMQGRNRCAWSLPILMALCLLSSPGACQKRAEETGNGSTTMASDPYPVQFADPRRSSYIPFSATCIGAVEWEKPLSKGDEPPFNPLGILVGQQVIVAYSERRAVCFSPEGSKLWTRDIFFRSPVWLVEDTVYYQSPQHIDRLGAVTREGRDVKSTLRILDANDVCSPVYLQPEAGGFYALCICRPAREVGPPFSKFYRKQYEPQEYDWVGDIKSKPPVLPLLIPELKRFVVFSDSEVLVCNSDTKEIVAEEVKRFALPLEALQCSAGKNGELYVIGREKRSTVFVALSLEGKELWRYGGTLGMRDDPKQAPLVGSDGTIFLAGGSTVVALQKGRVIHQYSTEGESIVAASVLSDGSLLVTAGKRLYQFMAEGGVQMSVKFDDPPLTPPVVDSRRRVYVATAKSLFKIQ